MIYLTKSALAYAANICEELPGYKVCIAVCKNKAIINFDITCMNIDDTATVRRTKDNISIYFNNGSFIDLFVARESCRGKRCHLLIADKDIDKELMNCVLRCMETCDYYKTV